MKEGVASREQEVHRLVKQEERAGNKITTIQSTLQAKETAVNQLVSSIKQEPGEENGQKSESAITKGETKPSEEQELQLLEFLQQVDVLAELKEKLLDAKEAKWDLERRIRAATTESVQLKEQLADMEAEVVSSVPE